MVIAIIGAGVAGIASLKYALEAGHECDCYEETGDYGGTWVYTDETGINDDGLPTYRSMYKNIVTTLPRELMSFSDFPYDESEKHVDLRQPEVLQYITKYVNTFELETKIKYYQQVTQVKPQLCGKWLITSKHVKSKIVTTKLYDFVLICNGHFRYTRIPKITGQNLFKGLQMHSRDFRSLDIFENKRVLIVGAETSGVDLSQKIKDVAKIIFLSHWTRISDNIQNVTNTKPAVTEFKEHSVVFIDDTIEDIDIVLYCTGYEYKFPFLSKDCGITVCDNWVKPLYKEIVNIKHPTMFFIGIQLFSAVFLLCDIQARFVIAIIENRCLLPSKFKMFNELRSYIKDLKNANIHQRHFHKLGFRQRSYFYDLATTASLVPFPLVYSNIYDFLIINKNKIHGGATRFSLLDDENFIKVSK